MGSRQEGHICDLKCPPKRKLVQGLIEVPSTQQKLFFQESLSGIQKRELVNCRLGAKVSFRVDKNVQGFFAKDLYIKPCETKQVKCTCGWEHLVGKGIQEGFVGKVERHYGFITKDYPRGRSPTGIYFNESELKGYPIMQLSVGDRVHFLVGQNDKGCVAQQIDVQGKNQFVTQGNFRHPSPPIVTTCAQGNFQSTSAPLDPRLFQRSPHDMFLAGQTNLRQLSPMNSPPVSPNTSPLRYIRMQEEEAWQNVPRRKR